MITFQNKFDYTEIGGQPYSANLFHEYAAHDAELLMMMMVMVVLVIMMMMMVMHN